MNIPRRKLLKYSAISILPVFGGYFSAKFINAEDNFFMIVKTILNRSLRDEVILDSDIKMFIDDFYMIDGTIDKNIRALLIFFDFSKVASHLNRHIKERLSRFERKILTSFLLHSNFFQTDLKLDHLRYRGRSPNVCSISNPFATFL